MVGHRARAMPKIHILFTSSTRRADSSRRSQSPKDAAMSKRNATARRKPERLRHLQFEGISIRPGEPVADSKQAVAAVRRILKAEDLAWRIQPYGKRARSVLVSPPPGSPSPSPAQAWELTYRLRARRDVMHVEPAFVLPAVGPYRAPARRGAPAARLSTCPAATITTGRSSFATYSRRGIFRRPTGRRARARSSRIRTPATRGIPSSFARTSSSPRGMTSSRTRPTRSTRSIRPTRVTAPAPAA
jgi:hypothetical protein